jgi:hypothetical protein
MFKKQLQLEFKYFNLSWVPVCLPQRGLCQAGVMFILADWMRIECALNAHNIGQNSACPIWPVLCKCSEMCIKVIRFYPNAQHIVSKLRKFLV